MTMESFQGVLQPAGELENAQHDRPDEGERDIGGHNAHAAGESHATDSLITLLVRPNAENWSPFPAEKLCCPSFIVRRSDVVKNH